MEKNSAEVHLIILNVPSANVGLEFSFSILLIACFAYGFNGLQTYNMSSALEYYIPNYSDTILPAVVGLLIAAATAFVIFGGFTESDSFLL